MPSRKEVDKRQRKWVSLDDHVRKETADLEGGYIHLPKGVEMFKPDAGSHKVDVMPFLAGKDNPGAGEGYEYFQRKVKIHQIPAPGGSVRKILCRNSIDLNKKCAVCECREDKKDDEKLFKDLRPKDRVIYLVNDRPGKKDVKWKVFEHHAKNRGVGLAELMLDQLNKLLDKGIKRPFGLASGYNVVFTVKSQSMEGGSKYNAVTRVDLEKRDYDYPDELLDEAPCLDEMLPDPGYDEVWSLLDPGHLDEDDDEPRPTKDDDRDDEPRSRTRTKDEDGDDEPRSRAKDDDPPPDFEKGDEVTFELRGKDYTGTIVKMRGSLADVEVEGRERPFAVDIEDLRQAKDAKEDRWRTRKADDDDNGDGKVTADDYDVKEGDIVNYQDEEVDVVAVSKDGTEVTVRKIDGERIKGVSPKDLRPLDNTKDKKSSKKNKDEEEPRKNRENSNEGRGKPSSEREGRRRRDDEPLEEDEPPRRRREESTRTRR